MSEAPGCVVDASALLALLQGEPGGKSVETAVEGSAMSAVNWSEVHHRLARGIDVSELRSDVEALGLELVPFAVADAELAATLWSSTRHLGLSLGDRACLALARRLERPALTADRAWLDLDVGVRVHAIR